MIKSNNFKNIFKKIFGSENETFRGSHMADGFSSYVKGFATLKKASQDSMGVSIEIDRIHNALYPPITVAANEPGYYSYSDEYFELRLENSELEKNLTKHFLDKHYSNNIYSGAYDLGMFFQSLCQDLVINRNTYSAISWEKVKIENNEYILPTAFNYLHPATISLSGNKNKNFIIKQRYPLWSIFSDHSDGVYNRNVKSDDALYLEYQFGKMSPVQGSLKFIPAIKKFYRFGIDQGEGNLNGKNHSLAVEMTRYKTYGEEKRSLNYARIKIRKEFNYLFEDQKLTSYYDVFTVCRYKKFLNDMRNYLLDEFNKQIMNQVAVKNNFAEMPIIKIKDGLFVTNKQIDLAFEKFKKKEITVSEFSNLIADNLYKTSSK